MKHSGSIPKSLAGQYRRHRSRLVAVVSMLVLLALPASVALAVPVEPVEGQLTQPNGTSFAATRFGDEWYNGYEHEGYTILLDSETGYWTYAVQSPDGSLAASGLRVGIDARPGSLSPHLRDGAGPTRAPASAGILWPEAWPGVAGSQPVLIILVDFTPSQSQGTTDAQWNAAFFNNAAGAKSVKNFYDEASYNIFTMDPVAESSGTANDGVIAVQLGTAHPDTGGSTGDANRTLVVNALTAANPFINFAALDTNGNNALDSMELHLVVIPRGFEESYSLTPCSPSVWGHRWSLGGTVAAPTLDGVRVGNYADGGGYLQFGEWHEMTSEACANTSSGGHMATIGIMAHELGHDINWPDLYDTDNSSEGVGYWSVMASGSWGMASTDSWSGTTPTHPDPWSKWYQHWLTPVHQTTTASNVDIPNSAQNSANSVYQLGNNPGGVDWEFDASSGVGEYWLVENRQQVGFDAGLWRAQAGFSGTAAGCIIWHIDETRISDNTNNDTESRKMVDVEEASAIQDMDSPLVSGGRQRGSPDDPWPGTESNTSFNSSSTPNSNYYDGAASGVSVTGISAAGTTGCQVDFGQVPTVVKLKFMSTRASSIPMGLVLAVALGGIVTGGALILHKRRRDSHMD